MQFHNITKLTVGLRFTYEMYAKITYVKIRMYDSNMKHVPDVRIKLCSLTSLYRGHHGTHAYICSYNSKVANVFICDV